MNLSRVSQHLSLSVKPQLTLAQPSSQLAKGDLVAKLPGFQKAPSLDCCDGLLSGPFGPGGCTACGMAFTSDFAEQFVNQFLGF